MTDWGAIGIAAIVLLMGAASPGPSLAVVVRNTSIGGRVGGVLCALGHGLGFGLYAVLAVVGLVTLITQWTLAFLLLQALGVVLLLYLGWNTLRRAGGASAAHAAGSSRAFAEGFTIAFANPKIALFFIAVFAAVLEPGMSRHTQSLIALTGWFIDTCWYLLVALALSTPQAQAWLRRNGKRFDQAMGAVLIALAIVTAGRMALA